MAESSAPTSRDAKRADKTFRRTEMKRDGRSALSLGRFINARKSTYDKRARIKQSRDEAAAKKAKYERLQKKLRGKIERDEGFDPEAYERRLAIIDNPDLAREAVEARGEDVKDEDFVAAGNDAGNDNDEAPEEELTVKGKKKKFDYLKKVREKGQAERAEREAQRNAFLEEKAARAAELKAQHVKRQDKKQLMRKKTKRGQPVMKHRVQNILDKLTAEQMGSSSFHDSCK
jgi:hypothetical protein